MPDIASVLKAEISRIARKEARSAVLPLRRVISQGRAEISALKRQVQVLEKQLKRTRVSAPAEATDASTGDETETQRLRFSAKGFAAQRQRLGLSAAQMGALLGVSDQSVYKWEDGKARPRARQLPAIAQLRKAGKKQVLAQLEAMTQRDEG